MLKRRFLALSAAALFLSQSATGLERTAMDRLLQLARMQPNSTTFRELLVKSLGEAEVTTYDGRHRTLGPGDHFGEMALLDMQGRSADITAKTDLVLAAVTEWGFKQFLADHPELTYRLLQTLSRRLREAEEAQKSRG